MSSPCQNCHSANEMNFQYEQMESSSPLYYEHLWLCLMEEGRRERMVVEQLHRENCRKFGNFDHYHFILVFQLLGQAARNMVLQEDAILHSEDSLRKMAIITTHLQYQKGHIDPWKNFVATASRVL
ncbi:BLOC-1 related complex subunit 7, transcript variant X2 [Ictidomys tridecemlineatus]|nr:BLOC-1 related complex subunit 7, transcript variant X2 [Ictidomys tridecemlineatus]